MVRFADPRFAIALLVILVAAAFDGMICYKTPTLDKEFLGVIIGAWNSGALFTAVTYWLGSSSGSQAKDETIRQAIPALRRDPQQPGT